MLTCPTAFAASLALALTVTLPPRAGIRWAPNLEAALAEAKAQNRVVMIAINMDDERANEELLRDHYRDALLAKLSQHTLNVFCSASPTARVSGISADAQNLCEREVREKILKVPEGKWLVAPQHVFVAPDGKILSSVPYRVTKGELEWAWVHAIRRLAPEFEWTLSAGARAPRRLSIDGQPASGNAPEPPPSKEEIDAVLKEVRKAGRDFWRNAREYTSKLLRSDEPQAIQTVEGWMRFLGGERKVQLLDQIAQSSPPAWWTFAARCVTDDDEAVRLAAIEALGELAEPKAATVLAKRYKEPEETLLVRGNILRAWARVAPKDRTLIRAIQKIIPKDKDEKMRAHAVVAVAKIEDRKVVTSVIGVALADASPLVRSAAAWAVATRRDAALRENVRAVLESEADVPTKQLLAAADKAIDGGDLGAFDGFVRKVDGTLPEPKPDERWGRGR